MAKRDYRKEYREYHGRPEQVARRSARNKSRRRMAAMGAAVSGRDVHHVDGNPRNMRRSNMRVETAARNRGRKS